MPPRVDVAVIGSGFAGSILAWILSRQGLRVALIDAARHPRFAIGESSTPIADTILRRLGETYDLSELASLSTWGGWQATHPELACGRKRGFSYFVHHAMETYSESQLGQRSLMVAASPNDEVADTQWYRPEVDAFFWRRAISAGAIDMTGHRVVAMEPADDSTWSIQCVNTHPAKIRCEWIIDASGQSGVLASHGGAANLAGQLHTRTHSTFAHYTGVADWTSIANELGLQTSCDPFDPDDAAQHHLVGEGWVWMLRFNNGITSVGYTTRDDCPLRTIDEIAKEFPTLGTMMSRASLVAPVGGAISSGRLQRWFDPVVDERRLMLPTASLTLDPLHSTGIAHALSGIERIVPIVLSRSSVERQSGIECYRRVMLEETRLLDRLVSTAYAMLEDFDRFTIACMLYFAGAIRCEERYQRGDQPTHLWNADDRRFVEFVDWACDRLANCDSGHFEEIRQAITPWNTAGLMDPTCSNRYAYTATKTAST